MNRYIFIIAILAALILLMVLIPIITHNPKTCSEFYDRKEMLHAFNTGLVKLDRDRDGIPCEGVEYK